MTQLAGDPLTAGSGLILESNKKEEGEDDDDDDDDVDDNKTIMLNS